MKRKRFFPEMIIRMLREANASLSQGSKVGRVFRQLGISEKTYYRTRKQYGGIKISQAKRMKELERENGRLKKAVAELTPDKLILKEPWRKTTKPSCSHPRQNYIYSQVE